MPETIFGLPSMVIVWGGVMVLFITGFMVFAIIKNKKAKSNKKSFLELHPDASKIYAMAKGVVTSDVVEIYCVDDKLPVPLTEAGKNGVYIAPGEHKITVSSTYTRPGVVYRSVSKSTGTVDKIVNIEPHSEYDLSFDRKEGTFAFEKRN
jgi:hypothetical protein